MKTRRKALVLAICALLLSAMAVSGTLAYMFDEDEQVNIFTVGRVGIDLDETPTDEEGSDPVKGINVYEMLLTDRAITKDPRITVKAGSLNCWVFVRVEKSENFDSYLEYGMAEGWVALGDAYPDVYYYYVPVTDVTSDRVLQVLADDTVTVKDSVTEEMLRGLAAEDAPTLAITAYAVQHAGFEVEVEETPEDAWKTIAG